MSYISAPYYITHTRTHTYTHAHTHTRMRMHAHTHTYTHTHTRTHTHTHTRARAQVLSRISREGSIMHQLEALREENKDLLCKYTATQVRT